MKKTCIFLLFLVVIAHVDAQSITTVILVRHAEKAIDNTDDPDLKAEGFERANRLAALFKNTPIDAVYATQYKRTKNTVAPLAQQKGLEVQIYQTVNFATINAFIEKHSGGTIVIGGHSNTTPQIANLLTGKEEFKTFPDSEYDNIFILSVVDTGKVAKVTVLNY